MSDERTDYYFNVRVPCSAPGAPRPVGIAARMAKVVADALRKDGLTIESNALPHGVGVECAAMTHHERGEA